MTNRPRLWRCREVPARRSPIAINRTRAAGTRSPITSAASRRRFARSSGSGRRHPVDRPGAGSARKDPDRLSGAHVLRAGHATPRMAGRARGPGQTSRSSALSPDRDVLASQSPARLSTHAIERHRRGLPRVARGSLPGRGSAAPDGRRPRQVSAGNHAGPIEDVIRGIGSVALRLVTFGRYRSGRESGTCRGRRRVQARCARGVPHRRGPKWKV